MPHELPKTYDPGAIEPRWAEHWTRENYYTVPTPENGANVFSILLPPPNVTGRLHMGHMLNQTEMDILIRWNRMKGKTALWLPGTDHAGIATQMMVERQLASEGKTRQQLGRDAFLQRVWEWKKQYGNAIFDQMKRLGASVDWKREYFTMDDRLSVAVREAFVRLHEQGLVYRGQYIVNWCPRCGTALSDLEVVHEETKGKLYEILYPIADAGGFDFVTVATTRPETMLGDTAVAVNPNDSRYDRMHGLKVRLPLIHRDIPFVFDDWADPEFGSGAVKITPAHDPNDFAVGQRHRLPAINVMDEHAVMNENAGPYKGLDRFEARKRVLADLEKSGQLVSVKDHTLSIGKCDRCKTIVEPRLSTQWFIKVKPMAERAIEVVEKNFIKITPENYRTIYLNWMRGIHDWCVSRQLWWGHRIPAWHCGSCNKPTVARETPTTCSHCGSTQLTQDPDVLDTWFSSGLLPFTVFGWPEKTKDLSVFYPTTLLVTGFDILFFWVARMTMLGCWFMGGENDPEKDPDLRDVQLEKSVPFQNVYIHALVRDADRQKMSKTKGNVIDPIEITERFGTDAVRFTLASQAAPGTDIAFNADRTDGYRAFANKLWNAARFIFMHIEKAKESGAWPPKGDLGSSNLPDVWINWRLMATARAVDEHLAAYRYDEATKALYQFVWNDFCDWYLEIAKLYLYSGEADQDKTIIGAALHFVTITFEQTLRLLAPFMPFITEEIWQQLTAGESPYGSIALAPYPKAPELNPRTLAHMGGIERDMIVLQTVISDIRNMRAEAKIETKAKAPVDIFTNSKDVRKVLSQNSIIIEKLANVSEVRFATNSVAEMQNVRVNPQYEVSFVYEHKVDTAAELDRLGKELKDLETQLINAHAKLTNEKFLSKASPELVEGTKKREAELDDLITKVKKALEKLQ